MSGPGYTGIDARREDHRDYVNAVLGCEENAHA